LAETIMRVLHLNRPQEDYVGELNEYRGTYTQDKKSRAGDEERLATKPAARAR